MTTFNGLRRNHRGQAESNQLDDQASRWKNTTVQPFASARPPSHRIGVEAGDPSLAQFYRATITTGNAFPLAARIPAAQFSHHLNSAPRIIVPRARIRSL
jgi:hypothetical protein